MQFGFDVISDLNLTTEDTFDWEGKATSLYCIVPGNISSDTSVIIKVLRELSKNYHGIFYIDGCLEHTPLDIRDSRIREITGVCQMFKNIVYLHNNVVIIDGIALVGVNGWYGNYAPEKSDDYLRTEVYRHEDLGYLSKTIEKLQLHLDVKKIVIISNCVPSRDLYYGEDPMLPDSLGPSVALVNDTGNKVVGWIFGYYDKTVDTVIDGINYINNSCYKRKPYWPKRFNVEV